MRTRKLRRAAFCLCLSILAIVPGAAMAGRAAAPDGSFLIATTYPNETGAFCERQYQECLAKCAANPDNQKDANSMTQCRAYCESVHSGCGK